MAGHFSLAILATSVFEISCGKQTNKHTHTHITANENPTQTTTIDAGNEHAQVRYWWTTYNS